MEKEQREKERAREREGRTGSGGQQAEQAARRLSQTVAAMMVAV